MNRRDFITLLGWGAATWPIAAGAQQQPKMLRVGFVGMQPREAPHYTNFLKRMAELGYQEGRNFTFDYIQTPNVEGYESNYRELATRKVDVFLAVGNEPALRAALSAADGKPIAFLAGDFDPLAKGYVANLSHPGGNVTRIFVRQLELAAKRVEIAREAFPRATLVGIAFDTLSHEQRDAAAEAARKLGLEPRIDRKSTRLNSSHSQISYAVFCLKKKTRHVDTSHRQTSYARFCLKRKPSWHHEMRGSITVEQ